jgi:hypothetical protein
LCECDGITYQTSYHLIFECERHEEKRITLKDKIIEVFGIFPCQEHNLIDERLFEYFKELCYNILN